MLMALRITISCNPTTRMSLYILIYLQQYLRLYAINLLFENRHQLLVGFWFPPSTVQCGKMDYNFLIVSNLIDLIDDN